MDDGNMSKRELDAMQFYEVQGDPKLIAEVEGIPSSRAELESGKIHVPVAVELEAGTFDGRKE